MKRIGKQHKNYTVNLQRKNNMRKAISKVVRLQVLSRFGGLCGYCGSRPEKLQVDHIHPVCRAYRLDGDVNDISNLMPSCGSCNNYKLNMTLEQFRRDLGRSIELARKYSVNFRNAERFGLISINPPEKIVFYFEKIILDN